MARRIEVDDGTSELLKSLLGSFSVKNAVAWLERKFESFDTSRAREIAVGETKNEKEYFKSARIIGFVNRLPEAKGGEVNRPVLVAVVEMKKIVTERASRLVQFNFAKKVLQNAVKGDAAGLDGYPSQGLFFFYDKEQFFRLSLVSGEMEGRRFKFNEAKRQSFFIDPDKPNNIARSRLNEPIRTFADLKEAFSVEKLTKEFYTRLYEWYEWAMKPHTGVSFPNRLDDDGKDDRDYNNIALIRLITRLMFVWFLRQRNVIPADLFDVAKLGRLLKKFEPESMEEDNYYRAILQNLFFATLNCDPRVRKRRFVKTFQGKSDPTDAGISTLYRFQNEFADKEAKDFLELMRGIPFLNCALFDCLDNRKRRPEEGGGVYYYDGFSRAKEKRAHVPNGLFFNSEKGLITLFNSFEFTIDENNADDADVALDPELLGKVFENLLGAYNPETKETARNATGSFYTPREIVDYMVEESLKNYLKTRLVGGTSKTSGTGGTKTAKIDGWLEDLFDRQKAAEGARLPFDDDVAGEIREALYSCQILDPACGSGAFPMGILNCMVRVLKRLDPAETDICDRIHARYVEEKNAINPNESAKVREKYLADVEFYLKQGNLNPEYYRKLFIIEKCIYGVDIQSIAVQITKLRFFVSLLCDQLRSNYKEGSDNSGILPLPNLETKFACANTLVALPNLSGGLSLSWESLEKKRRELAENRHEIFRARGVEAKKRLEENDARIRREIEDEVTRILTEPDEREIRVQEQVIAELKAERENYLEPKMVKQKVTRLKPLKQDDLFADAESGTSKTGGTGEPQSYEEEVEIMVDANEAKRNSIDGRIRLAESLIQRERNKANESNVLGAVKYAQLVASWDPYDQHQVSKFFDSKWMFNIEDGFDVVIGNPPYVSNMDDVMKCHLKQHFVTSSYLLDLYIAFVERSEQLLRGLGVLSYIMPNAWMKNVAQVPIRKFILEKLSVVKIVPKISNAFDSANVETCVLVAKKHVGVGPFEIVGYANNRFVHSHVSSTEYFIENDGCVFDVFLTEEVRSIIKKMRTNVRPVEDFFEIIRGIGPYKVGTAGQTPEIVRSKAYHASYRKDKTFVPELRGKHVQTFSYKWDGCHYISYGAWLSEPREPRFFEGNRLIFREILGERLVCTFISEPFKMDRSLYIAKPLNGDASFCRFVLGVLASRAMIYYFKNSANEFDELFPKIRVVEFRKLPLPSATSLEQGKISKLVDEILSTKAKDPSADTSALEARIDQLVYKLYGLTEEEIAVVEGTGEKKPPVPKSERPRRIAKPAEVVQTEDDDEELE